MNFLSLARCKASAGLRAAIAMPAWGTVDPWIGIARKQITEQFAEFGRSLAVLFRRMTAWAVDGVYARHICILCLSGRDRTGPV